MYDNTQIRVYNSLTSKELSQSTDFHRYCIPYIPNNVAFLREKIAASIRQNAVMEELN